MLRRSADRRSHTNDRVDVVAGETQSASDKFTARRRSTADVWRVPVQEKGSRQRTSVPDLPQALRADIPAEVDVSIVVIVICLSAITTRGNCSFNCGCIFDTLARPVYP